MQNETSMKNTNEVICEIRFQFEMLMSWFPNSSLCARFPTEDVEENSMWCFVCQVIYSKNLLAEHWTATYQLYWDLFQSLLNLRSSRDLTISGGL